MRNARRAPGRLMFVLALTGASAAAAAVPVHAQRSGGADHTGGGQQEYVQLVSELSRLREAVSLESAGDLAAAEEVVAGVLAANPLSLTAVLTMERLFALQGRHAEILPLVDRLLDADPGAVVGHQIRARTYDELDDERRLEAAAEEWIAATPDIETPYREVAALWARRGDHARAIEVLERGRARVDRDDALALELGDAYAAAGEPDRAATEWSRAVGPSGRGFMLVQRRLQGLPDGGARIIPALVDRLGGEPVTSGRQKAAVLLAIEAGLETRARRLASDLAAIVRIEQREPLLVEVARRADGAGLHRLALWAYSGVLDALPDPEAGLALRTRVAELALLAGDTALAARAYEQLEAAAAPGSPQRRQALAVRIELAAGEGDAVAAARDLETLREEFPGAAELDRAAAAVAGAHVEDGDPAAAARVLAGVTGPRSAHARGRLALRSGEIERGRDELLEAAALLRGREATETIALAALLMRVSATGGELVAGVVGAADVERAALIPDAARAARRLPARERAAVLEFLAASADRSGMDADADALRREIVADMPRAHEAPGALLALARRMVDRPGDAAGARVLLEKLIMEYPRSALVPQARRELQRLPADAPAARPQEGS